MMGSNSPGPAWGSADSPFGYQPSARTGVPSRMFAARTTLPKNVVDDLFKKVPLAGTVPSVGDGLPGAAPFQPPLTVNPEASFGAREPAQLPAWKIGLGALFDSIQQQTGGQATFMPTVLQQRQQAAQWAQDEARRAQDRAWQVEDRDAKLMAPEYFSAGRDRVVYDPITGESKVIYDAPEDYQDYAGTLGLTPGSPEYSHAVQDYILRSSGPTAQGGREHLESIEQINRKELEDYRQLNRVTLRNIPRPASGGSGGGGGGSRPPANLAAVVAPILQKLSQGKSLTPAEQQALDYYNRGRGTGAKTGAGATSAGITATDPKTGKKVRLVGGKWVPAN